MLRQANYAALSPRLSSLGETLHAGKCTTAASRPSAAARGHAPAPDHRDGQAAPHQQAAMPKTHTSNAPHAGLRQVSVCQRELLAWCDVDHAPHHDAPAGPEHVSVMHAQTLTKSECHFTPSGEAKHDHNAFRKTCKHCVVGLSLTNSCAVAE